MHKIVYTTPFETTSPLELPLIKLGRFLDSQADFVTLNESQYAILYNRQMLS